MAVSMLGAAAVVGGSRGWSLERTAEVTTRNARDALDPQRWGLGDDLSTQHGAASEGQRQPSAAEQRAAAAGLLDPMPPIGGDEDNH